MARFTLLLTGMFLLLLSLLSIWVTTAPGHTTLASLGISTAGLEPSSVQVPFLALFVLGYIFLSGNLLEGLTLTLSSAMVGGHTMSTQRLTRARRDRGPEVKGLLVWGVVAYVAVAFAFGTMLIMSSSYNGDPNFAQLFDPAMLATTMTWPWHFLASLGMFGLAPSEFYAR